MTMSAKKDAMANIGGWLAMNDDDAGRAVPEPADPDRGLPDLWRPRRARPGGHRPGPAARCVDEDYLRYRIRSTAYLGDGARRAGIPIVKPAGGHAVYIDARALLPHIPPLEYPGQALAVALYEAGGIRACEIGTVMFGRRTRTAPRQPAAMDLVRLAIPRRTYTQSHIDYVIEVVTRGGRARGATSAATASSSSRRSFATSRLASNRSRGDPWARR